MRLSLSLRQKKSFEGWVFILPWFVGFLLFLAYPLAISIVMSFAKVNTVTFNMRFVGFRNYTRAFLTDTQFISIFTQTMRNTVLDTPIIMFFSLFVAILLNRNVPGKTLLRGVFFLPVIVSTGYVIQELFGQGVGGIAVAMGTSGQVDLAAATEGAAALTAKTPSLLDVSPFLNEYLGSEIAAGISEFLNRLGLVLWRSGIQILIFLAGLQGISNDLYQAARIDGANEWELFWMVTLPIISPIILAVLIFTIVDSFMDIFNQVLDYIHSVAFTTMGGMNFGYAASLSWIYFISIFALILILYIIIGRKVFYQGEK